MGGPARSWRWRRSSAPSTALRHRLLRIPPIVMTLATNVVLQGLLLVVTRGFPPPPSPAALQWLANGRIGPVYPVMLVRVARARRRGARGRAADGLRPPSLRDGQRPDRGHALRGPGGTHHDHHLCDQRRDRGARRDPARRLRQQSYLGMGDPYLFTSIAAVAIGGASILGGTGSYLGSIAGALVLTVLTGLLPIFRLWRGRAAGRLRPGHPGDGRARRAARSQALLRAATRQVTWHFLPAAPP